MQRLTSRSVSKNFPASAPKSQLLDILFRVAIKLVYLPLVLNTHIDYTIGDLIKKLERLLAIFYFLV